MRAASEGLVACGSGSAVEEALGSSSSSFQDSW